MKRRILCLFLALICIFSLCLTGCGKIDNTPETTDGAGNQTTQPTVEVTQPTDEATQAPTEEATAEPTITEPSTEPVSTEPKPTEPVPTEPKPTEPKPTEPAPTEPEPTEPTPTEPADPFQDAVWNEDNTLKILMIGNSFSVDCIEYVYQIAQAAGVKNIKLGNLYISGCTLKTHLANAEQDKAAYTYYTNNSGKWVTTKSYKMSDAIKSEDWDFISFQQASGKSTKPDTYGDLDKLMPIVEGLCTNPKVQFIWQMTWAYRGDSVSDAYDNDQKQMYEAVVDAVQERIVPNNKIVKIIPSGTAIQNARSSYLGDTLNRDEYHLSKVEGRIIAGIGMVATVVGIDYDNIDLSSISKDQKFLQVALESVKNAMEKPFEITQSAFTK